MDNSQVPGSLSLRGATHTVGPCKLKTWKQKQKRRSNVTLPGTYLWESPLERTCILKTLIFQLFFEGGFMFLMASCIYHHCFPLCSSVVSPTFLPWHPWRIGPRDWGNLFVSRSHLQGAKQTKKIILRCVKSKGWKSDRIHPWSLT